MEIKKFKLFLASDIEKEEAWLTEMSKKGLHLKDYKLFTYVFEEDPNRSYVYQTDFRPQATEDYFQLYEDAGWEYVTDAVNLFHYFRTDASEPNIGKLYTDKESIQESFKRMMTFYLSLFFMLLVAQSGILLTWQGRIIQYIAAALVLIVIVLYVYMLLALRKRVNFYRRK
jgi:hypothetical protein